MWLVSPLTTTHPGKCVCRRCWITASDDSVHLPLGIRYIPSLPVAVLPNIRLSREDSWVPSTLLQKFRQHSRLQRRTTVFKSSSSFAMFIPVLFRSGFICYMKGSIGLYFEFFELIVPPGNTMSASYLTQGACFLIGINKKLRTEFTPVNFRSMSAWVLTLPIHKPIDWLNSLSNTSQFVRLGLRQYLEAGLSCSSRK